MPTDVVKLGLCIPEEDKEKTSQWRLLHEGSVLWAGGLYANCLKAPFSLTLARIGHLLMLWVSWRVLMHTGDVHYCKRCCTAVNMWKHTCTLVRDFACLTSIIIGGTRKGTVLVPLLSLISLRAKMRLIALALCDGNEIKKPLYNYASGSESRRTAIFRCHTNIILSGFQKPNTSSCLFRRAILIRHSNIIPISEAGKANI